MPLAFLDASEMQNEKWQGGCCPATGICNGVLCFPELSLAELRVGWRWQRAGLGGLAGSEASPRSCHFSLCLRACRGGDGVRRKLAFLPWGGLGSRLCIKQVVNPCGFQTPWPGNGSNTEIWIIFWAVIWGQAWLSPGMLWAQVHPAAGGPLRHQGFWGSLFLLRLNPFVGKRVFQA